MDYRYESDEFHHTLEPMVIIDDELSPEEDGSSSVSERNPLALDPLQTDLIEKVGPEISIIPVERKRSSFKIRLFSKEYSPDTDNEIEKVHSFTRSPREKVRRISKDEELNTEDTYAKRKSRPLEKCPLCKKYFRRMKSHLLKHDMVNRSPEDRLSCTFCQKTFNTPSNLAIHMRTHTGDKPYLCEVCQKSFSQSCNLVNHMRVHTGEKPFKCPYCDRAFTQSGNLNNHIRLHTDEKPFKCHFCDKAFVQSGNLNSHIRNNHKFSDRFVETSIQHSV